MITSRGAQADCIVDGVLFALEARAKGLAMTLEEAIGYALE